MPTEQLMLFIAAGWLLNLTPGPDVLYIVTHSLRGGVRAGLVAGWGITAGCFVHILAVAAGVSALMVSSVTAFTLLKWVGAAYLVWTGVKLLLSKGPAPEFEMFKGSETLAAQGLLAVFSGGFWTNVLNPKVAIFFLAFVPQFIGHDVENKAWAFVLLGTLFNVNALPVNAGWAIASAWMAKHQGVQLGMHWLDRLAGAMLIGFGLKLALTDNPNA